MSDFTLVSDTPLNGYRGSFEGINVAEVNDYELISLATAQGQEHALAAVIAETFDTTLPEIGRFTESSHRDIRFLGLQTDQCFVMLKDADPDAGATLDEKTQDVAYLCDQSDSWAILRLEGERCLQVLERICPLDMAPEVFKQNSVQRTMMEHLSVIIAREDTNRYLLLSPRSSAASFLHMILMAIKNTG